MSALSYTDINNSDQTEAIFNVPEALTSYATDVNPEARQQFGNILCQILKKQSLEDILTHIHELIAAILTVSEDDNPIVRASLVEQIPHIFLQCHEHACPDLEHYLYDRLLQIVLDYLQDAEDEVSGVAYSALQILLDKYVLDKKRIEEKVCPAIVCPMREIDYACLKEFNINSIMLMGRIAPIIGPEKTDELFLSHFIEFCKCKINCVRRACSTIFPTICYVLGTNLTEEKLLEVFFQLCADPFWGVRKACAESVALISLICSLDCRRNRIAPIVIKLAKDENKWVKSATFKILGHFISSFAQPCITGLAYSYNGELLVTNPVDPDFRDHSDPQTLANYDYYLKMFENTDSTEGSANTIKNTAVNFKTNNKTSNNICDETATMTPKNIAQLIIDNKTKLTEQITVHAWPKQKIFKNYVFKECSKYIDLDTGNNNILTNSERNNVEQGNNNNDSDKNLCFGTEILDSEKRDSTSISSNETSDFPTIDSLNSKNDIQEEKPPQEQENQQSVADIGNSTTANTNTLHDNIFNNFLDSKNPSFESNLHRRRYHRNVYSFWRKNTPTDLQSIIKKAIHDAQDNVKPPLPPPPPHPLKLPSKSASPEMIGSTSASSLQNLPSEQLSSSEELKSNTSNESHHQDDSKQDNRQEQRQFRVLDQEAINFFSDAALTVLSLFGENNDLDFYNSSVADSYNNINKEKDTNMDNSSANNNLNDKKDKNGNEDDDAFREFNSYNYWHISPDMPLDSNIVGNSGGTWNMKMLNDTLSTTNSSILDDDIVTKSSKFLAPTSFEQNIIPAGLLEAYVTMVMHEEDDEVTFTCAYNFPAVVSTLGRSNWHILKSLLQYLCEDIDWKVRKTIALSINFLALILGKEIATRDLVPVYLGFFKDLDEVKIEAIRNFASFLKAIEKSKHEEILSNIGICLRFDSQANWRIKEDLAKEVWLVIKTYDSVQNYDILLSLTSLTGYFLEDKVSCVREIAADAMAEIIRISSAKYKEAIVRFYLINEFANSSKWRNRQTFLFILYKYNLLQCSKFPSNKLLEKQSDSFSEFSSTVSSPSPDLTTLDNNTKDISDILQLVFPSIERLSHDFVPNIRLLVAKYLVLLVNMNGISDDIHESFVKIVRRLRHDEDRDVKEIFDSVDLLREEVDEKSPVDQKNNTELQSKNSEHDSEMKAVPSKNFTTSEEPPLSYSDILKSNLDKPSSGNNQKIYESKNVSNTETLIKDETKIKTEVTLETEDPRLREIRESMIDLSAILNHIDEDVEKLVNSKMT